MFGLRCFGPVTKDFVMWTDLKDGYAITDTCPYISSVPNSNNQPRRPTRIVFQPSSHGAVVRHQTAADFPQMYLMT